MVLENWNISTVLWLRRYWSSSYIIISIFGNKIPYMVILFSLLLSSLQKELNKSLHHQVYLWSTNKSSYPWSVRINGRLAWFLWWLLLNVYHVSTDGRSCEGGKIVTWWKCISPVPHSFFTRSVDWWRAGEKGVWDHRYPKFNISVNVWRLLNSIIIW